MNFKVGDRVRVGTNGGNCEGRTGTVTVDDGGQSIPLRVDYDSDYDCSDGHDWYNHKDLEPLVTSFKTSEAWQKLYSDLVTKDSGDREDFGNGSVRDTEEGKPRYDLITPIGLKRIADLMARGAKKYGERNWEKGQPATRFMSSLMRHVENYRLGDREEDHLAAIAYNVLALMHFEGTGWDDINKVINE